MSTSCVVTRGDTNLPVGVLPNMEKLSLPGRLALAAVQIHVVAHRELAALEPKATVVVAGPVGKERLRAGWQGRGCKCARAAFWKFPLTFSRKVTIKSVSSSAAPSCTARLFDGVWPMLLLPGEARFLFPLIHFTAQQVLILLWPFYFPPAGWGCLDEGRVDEGSSTAARRRRSPAATTPLLSS